MTDRIRHLTVVLDADYRDEDAERIIDAIQMVRGVNSVEGHVKHSLNQAIDHMIDADRKSPADDLIAKVRSMCAEVPIDALRTAIDVHRSNCHQHGCPVLAAMEDRARAREVSP